MCTATCPDLYLTNGMISYSPDTTPRLEGTVATHSCDVGYILSGGTERTCQSDRTWSGGNITCEGNHTYSYIWMRLLVVELSHQPYIRLKGGHTLKGLVHNCMTQNAPVLQEWLSRNGQIFPCAQINFYLKNKQTNKE